MIIDQRNRGLCEARNTGAKYSNGEFIYFIDSDDYLEESALFELYDYGTKNNLDSIYFYFIKFKNFNLLQNIGKKQNITRKNYILNPKYIMKGKHLFAKKRKKKNIILQLVFHFSENNIILTLDYHFIQEYYMKMSYLL